MQWIVRNPFLATALAVTGTLALSTGISRLTIDASSEGLLSPDDAEVIFYQQAKMIYGDDVTLTVILKANEIFKTDVLEAVERLTLRGEKIDGVTRVISLVTVGNLKGRDDLLNTERLLPYIPEDPEEMSLIKSDALSNHILVGEVVNQEGTTAAIHLSVEARPELSGYEDRLVADVEKLIEAERTALGEDVEIYQYGSPYAKTKVVDYIKKDGMLLGPASLAVTLLLLYFFFRSTLAMIIPGITGVLSVAATLGFMGFMGYAVNPLTGIIPRLVLVIGCTEDIHLISEYALGLRAKKKKREAVMSMAVKSGVAILLTSLTTFIGFLTIAPNSIPMLREFGIAASFGIAANFILTILLVPSITTWFPAPKAFLNAEASKKSRFEIAVVRSALTGGKVTVAITLVVCVVAVWGCFLVKVDTDYLNFFKKDSDVRMLYDDVSESLVGANSFYVVIDGKREGAMTDPETLKEVDKLGRYLAGRFDKQLGYADFIRKIHVEMNNGDESFRKIPDSGAVISQYSLMLDPDDIDRFVNFDRSEACILVRTNLKGSEATTRMLKEVNIWISQNISKSLDVRMTGEKLLISRASDMITKELMRNLIYVFAAIFVIISILFFSIKAGLLAMIPNTIPVLVNFGAMGLLGIPLSAATFPVAIIALGIAVDDTIHIMVRYSKEVKATSVASEAIARTIEKELRPVATTSVALIFGFLVLTLGEFVSIQQFGILSAITMLAAFLTDIYVTPLLLRFTPMINARDLMKLKNVTPQSLPK